MKIVNIKISVIDIVKLELWVIV